MRFMVAAGSVEFSDAVQLVKKRGAYMQAAVPAGVGAMAALLKLPDGALDGILSEAAQGEVVTAANFNSPMQVVIAGHTGAVERAEGLVRETPGAFMVGQFENPANPEYHANTTGPEILRDFANRRLDYYVSGYGTGGTITGAGQMIRLAKMLN